MIKDKKLKSNLSLLTGASLLVFSVLLFINIHDYSYSVKKGKNGKTIYIHVNKKDMKKTCLILAFLLMTLTGVIIVINSPEESEE